MVDTEHKLNSSSKLSNVDPISSQLTGSFFPGLVGHQPAFGGAHPHTNKLRLINMGSTLLGLFSCEGASGLQGSQKEEHQFGGPLTKDTPNTPQNKHNNKISKSHVLQWKYEHANVKRTVWQKTCESLTL